MSDFCSVSVLTQFEYVQDIESDVKQKYSGVEQLIGQKAGGVADAKRRAESLQKEAKDLLLQANEKLQLLKGDASTLPTSRESIKLKYG